MNRIGAAAIVLTIGSPAGAEEPPREFASGVKQFIRASTARTVITHVRIIDGTGAAPVSDRNVVIEDGRIAAIGAGFDVEPAEGTTVLDGRERTVLPGLVCMHEHMYYIARPNLNESGRSEEPLIVPQMMFSAPRLYLAAGITTARTCGSVEGQSDINLRDQIDASRLVGPHLDVTAPYLQGQGGAFIQMYQLKDAADARRFVNFWADAGATSFKAYMHITREELGAAIEEAHKRGLKVTGHLCSVTYPEAIALGIDDLEHGFMVNTDLAPGKRPDVCPGDTSAFIERAEPDGPEAKALIADLIAHHVAITSTLPVFEGSVPDRPPLNPRAMEVLTEQARASYMFIRNRTAAQPPASATKRATTFARGQAMELAFAKAGGLLIAGCDPTGNGGVIPGFSDHREIELLVEAGFSPTEAIKVSTLNGAMYLGRDKTIGSVEVGKNADLFMVAGDPSRDINDIEKVELVIKDGVVFDSQKLIDSVKGRYGQY